MFWASLDFLKNKIKCTEFFIVIIDVLEKSFDFLDLLIDFLDLLIDFPDLLIDFLDLLINYIVDLDLLIEQYSLFRFDFNYSSE